MELTRLSLDELESLNLTEMKKEEIEQVIEIADHHEFMINMADRLDDGDYRAMAQCRRIIKKCKDYLGE